MTNMLYDYFIVGQGIAGTLIANELIKQNKRILVFDQNDAFSSSKIAAGIINPITGRRFVKSWKIDELLSFANALYADLEGFLKTKIITNRQIVRVLQNPGEENTWLNRSIDPEYLPYLSHEDLSGNYKTKIKNAYSYLYLTKAAQVDFPTILKEFRAFLLENNRIVSESFDYNQLNINITELTYKAFKSKSIIFCEGAKAINNIWFNYLPFNLAKGERFIISSQDLKLSDLLKHKLMFAPICKDQYWVGSSNEWGFNDDLPSEKSKKYLLKGVEESLNVDFDIVNHNAAIRPTVKDRRPFLGRHPKFSNLIIFNGMGTKGASLAPYFANELANHLIFDAPLSKEVDIERFS